MKVNQSEHISRAGGHTFGNFFLKRPPPPVAVIALVSIILLSVGYTAIQVGTGANVLKSISFYANRFLSGSGFGVDRIFLAVNEAPEIRQPAPTGFNSSVTLEFDGQNEWADWGSGDPFKTEIIRQIGFLEKLALPLIDLNALRFRLSEIPSVESVSVRKLYPSGLGVLAQRRLPSAVWQSGPDLWVVDINGQIIAGSPGSHEIQLPLVVGEGAAKTLKEIIPLVQRDPLLASRIQAFNRISHRRWDLHLISGMVVRLPQDQPVVALAKLSVLQQHYSILDRDLEIIDLRLPDRIVVRPALREIEKMKHPKAVNSTRGTSVHPDSLRPTRRPEPNRI